MNLSFVLSPTKVYQKSKQKKGTNNLFICLKTRKHYKRCKAKLELHYITLATELLKGDKPGFITLKPYYKRFYG